ncbi:MAG: ABC transporter substrate-binding protein [Anaerolineales bacterium]|nr:ABC transporter substrate-binding protein [Anaerolineales bacterium]
MWRHKSRILLIASLIFLVVLGVACSQPTAEPEEAQPEVIEEEATTEEEPVVVEEEVAEEEEAEPVEEAAEPEPSGGIIKVGVTYDTNNMDHLTTGDVFTAQRLIFDTLVVRGPDGEYYPLLAQSWTVSDDNLEWTFTLRDDVTFHDGTPFNAEAAKWFYDKARDPEGQHAFSDSYASVDDILAPDETTLIFKLNNPWPNILFTLSNSFSGLISPTAYEKYGDEYGSKYAVGSGPFILESWVPQERTIVVRNPDYNWGPEFLQNQGAPYVDGVELIYFPESTTRVSELETGGIDFAYGVPPIDLPRIEEAGIFDVYTMPAWGGALFYLDLNQTKPPLDDVRVRQALNYAIDIEAIASLVLGEFGSPAYGYMAEHWNCGVEDPKAIGYGYDSAKAQELLTEAGWTDTDGDGIIDKDGEAFSRVMIIYNDSESQLYGELIQNQLAEVGIELELQLLEYSTMVELFQANENDIGLINYGWSDSDVYNLFFKSDQIPYLNSSHVDDPKMDELLEMANTAPTAEERCGYFAQVEEYAIEQAEWVTLFWFTDVLVANQRLQGVLVTPHYESFNDVIIAE